MEENNRSVSLALLGAVAVIAVVGLVLMFTSAQKTGQVAIPSTTVVGSGSRGEQYPYLSGRNIGTDYEKWGDEQDAWQTGVPYRTYSRAPPSLPVEYTTCGRFEREMGSTLARAQEARYDVKCRRSTTGTFCCPLPDYATGTAREVEYQSYWS